MVARHVSVGIERPVEDVYVFVAEPKNLPEWAAGLARSVHKVEDDWFADSPMGRVRFEFTAANEFGVLDHVVTLANGERILNPMRVVQNGDGCEVVFTLFRRDGVSDADFEADAAAVLRDLRSLKALLEGAGPRMS